METLIKIGNARHLNDPTLLKNWLDGQIIMRRPDGFGWGRMERRHFAIIRTTEDYWQARGSTNWKANTSRVHDFAKYEFAMDSNGRYPWEAGYLIYEKRIRMRDWFIDFAWLATQNVPLQWLEDIYNYDKETEILNIDRPLTALLTYENERNIAEVKNAGITSGIYSIGSGLDYSTVAGFATDVNAGEQMDGDLTGEHNDEETAISDIVTFDTDTNSHLLKLTAQSGDEHDGSGYNGARINYDEYDAIHFDETTDGEMDDVEVSCLALDITGNGNRGVRFVDGGNSGLMTCNRMFIKGDSLSNRGIELNDEAVNALVTNNIVYGLTHATNGYGIVTSAWSSGDTHSIYNNTVCKCRLGIRNTDAAAGPTRNLKNNLCQGNTTDYSDQGGGWDNHAFNISEDSTSPDDGIYDDLNCHDGNSCFQDYSNDDYRLVATGDEIFILDNAEDLSGIFTDDVVGTIRNTWYSGAFEIPAGAEEEAALTLAGYLGLSQMGGASAGGAMGLAKELGTQPAGEATAGGTMTLAEYLGIQPAGGAVTDSIMALAKQLGIQPAGEATAGAVMTLAKQLGIQLSSGATAGASLMLALQHAIAYQALVEYGAALTLSATMAVSAQGVVTAQSAITFSNQLQIQLAGGAVADAALSLAAQLAAAFQAAGLQVNVDVTLAQAMDISQAASAVSNADLELLESLGLVSGAQAAAAAAIALAYQKALAQAGSMTAEAEIDLSEILDLAQTGSMTAEAGINLSGILELQQSASMTAEGALTLEQIAGLILIGGALADAGIALSAISEITLAGERVAIVIDLPARRTQIVTAESRMGIVERDQ